MPERRQLNFTTGTITMMAPALTAIVTETDTINVQTPSRACQVVGPSLVRQDKELPLYPRRDNA